MGVNANIQIALDTRLNTLASNTLEIAWPNVSYNPKGNMLFLRPHILPAKTELYTLTNQRKYSGIYQIDIYVPEGTGLKNLYETADTIQELFSVNTTLTANSAKILIQNISITPVQANGINKLAFHSMSVDINYLSYQ